VLFVTGWPAWAGNKLHLNGALFFRDYKDLQAFGLLGNEFRIFNCLGSPCTY
jgi:hypothetical protein